MFSSGFEGKSALGNKMEEYSFFSYAANEALHLSEKEREIVIEQLLKESFTLHQLGENGIPSVKELAKEMGYSTNYLSDLLKKETGKNTQEHIHYQIIHHAKKLLSGTSEPISNIAYKFGFEYPTNFSKFLNHRLECRQINLENIRMRRSKSR
jgi:AraC-like DNA-binding protein